MRTSFWMDFEHYDDGSMHLVVEGEVNGQYVVSRPMSLPEATACVAALREGRLTVKEFMKTAKTRT